MKMLVRALSGIERSPTGINSDNAPPHTYSTNKRTTGPLSDSTFFSLSCLIREESNCVLPSIVTLAMRAGRPFVTISLCSHCTQNFETRYGSFWLFWPAVGLRWQRRHRARCDCKIQERTQPIRFRLKHFFFKCVPKARSSICDFLDKSQPRTSLAKATFEEEMSSRTDSISTASLPSRGRCS